MRHLIKRTGSYMLLFQASQWYTKKERFYIARSACYKFSGSGCYILCQLRDLWEFCVPMVVKRQREDGRNVSSHIDVSRSMNMWWSEPTF